MTAGLGARRLAEILHTLEGQQRRQLQQSTGQNGNDNGNSNTGSSNGNRNGAGNAGAGNGNHNGNLNPNDNSGNDNGNFATGNNNGNNNGNGPGYVAPTVTYVGNGNTDGKASFAVPKPLFAALHCLVWFGRPCQSNI